MFHGGKGKDGGTTGTGTTGDAGGKGKGGAKKFLKKSQELIKKKNKPKPKWKGKLVQDAQKARKAGGASAPGARGVGVVATNRATLATTKLG